MKDGKCTLGPAGGLLLMCFERAKYNFVGLPEVGDLMPRVGGCQTMGVAIAEHGLPWSVPAKQSCPWSSIRLRCLVLGSRQWAVCNVAFPGCWPCARCCSSTGEGRLAGKTRPQFRGTICVLGDEKRCSLTPKQMGVERGKI